MEFVCSFDSTTRRDFNSVAFATQKVATLVDDSNFLAWKQHVLLVLKTHPLQQSVSVLPHTITDDAGHLVENLTFVQYEQQDSTLSAWLLSTVSASFHNQLIGSSSSAFTLWEALTRIFGT
ncbi:hypothetical protein CXB51_035264 [Gossypium anomalum]|uniref:Retrotransposon Copia-like N-terminal domain-containing protein n=1 Tax=Gossypium anomalum TaxID=47600 RepID=A0A8J5Y683_9ROSI|nr:hypothetical protein CXB51_035264 [Gossypium anomalum]